MVLLVCLTREMRLELDERSLSHLYSHSYSYSYSLAVVCCLFQSTSDWSRARIFFSFSSETDSEMEEEKGKETHKSGEQTRQPRRPISSATAETLTTAATTTAITTSSPPQDILDVPMMARKNLHRGRIVHTGAPFKNKLLSWVAMIYWALRGAIIAKCPSTFLFKQMLMFMFILYKLIPIYVYTDFEQHTKFVSCRIMKLYYSSSVCW